MTGIALGYKPDPDWRRLAKALQRAGEPDRVPLFELTISFRVIAEVLGCARPAASETRDVRSWTRFRTDFYHRAGYDFVGVGSLFGFSDNKERTVSSCVTAGTVEPGTIHDRRSLEQYRWPQVRDEHLAYVEAAAAILPEGMKVRPRCPGGVLASTVNLMGFEGLSYALADDPELVGKVTAEIGKRLADLAGRYAAHPDVEFITLGDDMGFRTGTMISPAALREHVFPWHRRIVEAIHAGGKLAVLHSDGNLAEVMDDIIACGWDAKHSVEDAIMPAPEMKRRWGSRIAICGAIDVDDLTRCTPTQIRQRTHALIAACSPGGGWALGSGNAVSDYVPVENYVAMLRAARNV